MATYVTKRCPHCGKSYQFLQFDQGRQYGCPQKTCLYCNEIFWDTDIKEPALYGYNNFYETRRSLQRYITVVLYSLFGAFCIVAGIGLFIESLISDFSSQMSWLYLLFIALGIGDLWLIVSEIKHIINEKKHKSEIVFHQQEEYDASMTRLQNTNYLSALACYDSRANKLLNERLSGKTQHYAPRPE